ncbi:unnamed protein product [Caenorhabditis angaria]|uniref:Uncharacterized protein n=1 Tax=Caenorhabditis angaria TaxID=860376 RepID=A0A9P1MZD8_9PELO|nr:unnamed protein product [Caenorhabditis angaria]
MCRFQLIVLVFLAIFTIFSVNSFTLYRPSKPNHHSGSDSRAVSENVDLDDTDDGSFDRMRDVLGNIRPSVGLMHSFTAREK